MITLGPLGSNYGRKMTSSSDDDIAILEIKGEILYLQRYYGQYLFLLYFFKIMYNKELIEVKHMNMSEKSSKELEKEVITISKKKLEDQINKHC